MIKSLVGMIAVLAIITAVMATSSVVYGCQTNANGCIKNNGPGNSGDAPAEVSGCHFFTKPASICTQDTNH